MKRPTIIEVAAVAGIVAFLWTIVTSKPARDRRAAADQPAGSRSGPVRGAFFRDPPTDLPGLILRVRNDPGDIFALFSLARRYHMHGKEAESREAYTQLIAKTQDLSPEARTFGRNVYLRAQALRALGRDEEAGPLFAHSAEWYTKRAAENPDFRANRALLIRLGWARKLSGDDPGAREAWSAAFDSLWQIVDGPDPTVYYDRAVILALLDRPDEALVALTHAADRGYDDPEGAAFDEAFAPLKDDERFQRIIDWFRRNDTDRRWNELFGPRMGGHGLLRGSAARQL